MGKLKSGASKSRVAQVIADGKTKRIREVVGESGLVIVESKPTLSKGDGAVIVTIPGKDEWATRTTCNVFKLLKFRGIRTAFLKQLDRTKFLALRGEMIKYEVVIRGIATGSYCKRHPEVVEGTVFPVPVVEFFLKTTNKRWPVWDAALEEWGSFELEVDDPFVVFDGNAKLYHPRKPMVTQMPMLELDEYPLSDSSVTIIEIIKLARSTFLVLREAWENQDATFYDLKIEIQLDKNGRPIVSDVIDADSWRVQDKQGKHLDKQPFREGASLQEVAEIYKRVAALTDKLVAMD